MRQVGMDDVDKLATPSIPGYLGSNKGHPVKEGVLHERLHHESAPGNTEIGNIDNQTFAYDMRVAIILILWFAYRR